MSIFPGRVAMVCASNQNRSMAAHDRLVHHAGYPKENVFSYGTGTAVRLPGPTADAPNVYPFGTPYATMLDDLVEKDPELYERLGLISMLERNVGVKMSPSKFQTTEDSAAVDVVVTFETRVFDAVLEHLANTDAVEFKPVHVLGLHVKDNPTAAEEGAQHTVELLERLANAGEQWEADLGRLLDDFQRSTGKQVLHAVYFY